MSEGSGTGALLDDLRAEGNALDAVVAELPAVAWAEPTPAAGWTVAHQIAHLAWTDEQALLAARDVAAFRDEVEHALASPHTFVDEGAQQGAEQPPCELLEGWRAGRAALLEVLAAQPHGQRLPWYGPPMSAASMATARIMETWAHGWDVAEALGVVREPTQRLRHVVWLGVRTRDFAFGAHGHDPPAAPFRVELAAPDGSLWTYGPPDAVQRVAGPALDFCLLVTQRTHRADTALWAEGADAHRWLDIAQAFAGPPGNRRAPQGGSGGRPAGTGPSTPEAGGGTGT